MHEIIRLSPEDTNFNLFEDLVSDLYEPDTMIIKKGESINAEYLQGCFVLLDEGIVKCRGALYNNPHLFYRDRKAACIGNYESVNEPKMADFFLKHITMEAKKIGADFIIGPMNGSTWDEYRFAVDHNHQPFFSETYHHLYYNDHFKNNGFQKIATYFSGIETDLTFDSPSVFLRRKEFQQSGVTFRNINLNNFKDELGKIYLFNLVAFKNNFLYTPVSYEWFQKKYAALKGYIDPEFVIFAEDAGQNLIGYIFCLPDFYNKQQKTLIVKTAARHPGEVWKGTGHVLGSLIIKKAVKSGYQSIIHSFMHEEGTSLNMSQSFSGKRFKDYFLYGKEL